MVFRKDATLAVNYANAFHPRDHRLAVCHGNAVTVFDADTGRTVATINQPGRADGVWWRPDGRGLAVVAQCEIYLWDLEDASRPQAILHGPKAAGISGAFSRSGNLLASTGWDRIARIWDRRSGQQLIAVDSIPHFGIRFSADDQRLLMVDQQRMRFLDIVSPVECRTVYTHEQRTRGLGSIDFSPDGRLLATAAGENACLWDPRTARQVQRLDVGAVQQARFHPDGLGMITVGAGGVLTVGTDEAVHLWDLRAVRARLKSMGLDWESPPASASGI